VLEKALARKLDNPMLHATMYRVARFQNDTALAEAQRSWSARQPIQDGLGWMFGDELGQRGQLNLLQQSLRAEARELSEAGLNDAAADDLARLTLIEAELGDTQAVAADSGATLALSRGRARLPQLAIAFALVGDNTRAKALLEELQRRFPHDFFARRVYIPLARALMLANDGNTDEALRVLDPVRRFDFGRRWYFMPLYVRGLVFLKNGDTTAARGEFQKIIDHRGISVFALEWVLAHLGKARALAQADEREMRRAAYQQFFNLWEGADPDIPILQQAWREYAQPAELASQASYSGAARTDGRANNRRE
jgi:tetratricopeptide (TPR) repeat protein